jgi:cyclopropane-fatty-acyl-phospholipid synthase
MASEFVSTISYLRGNIPILPTFAVLVGLLYLGYKTLTSSAIVCKVIIMWWLDKYDVDITIEDRSDLCIDNGPRSGDSDIVVHNSSWWVDMYKDPSLALGDGYMEGKWSTKDLKKTLRLLLEKTKVRNRSITSFGWLRTLFEVVRNVQSIARSKQVANVHYDISPALYKVMLDPWMQYSCGWWGEGITTLEEAQGYKLQLICEKLQLKAGMKVLDVGCGWGGLMSYMKKNYNVHVVGLTISEEQIKLGSHLFPNIDGCFVLEDYRTWCPKNIGTFDRVVSVGMFEHVGYANYGVYMKHVHSVLKPNGIFLLHTIGSTIPSRHGNVWITKHIFPNSALPCVSVIAQAIEADGLFIMEDMSNTPAYYVKTLASWYQRYNAAEKRGLPDTFHRMWQFYLNSSEVAFDVGALCLYQFILTPKGYMNENGKRLCVKRVT